MTSTKPLYQFAPEMSRRVNAIRLPGTLPRGLPREPPQIFYPTRLSGFGADGLESQYGWAVKGADASPIEISTIEKAIKELGVTEGPSDRDDPVKLAYWIENAFRHVLWEELPPYVIPPRYFYDYWAWLFTVDEVLRQEPTFTPPGVIAALKERGLFPKEEPSGGTVSFMEFYFMAFPSKVRGLYGLVALTKWVGPSDWDLPTEDSFLDVLSSKGYQNAACLFMIDKTIGVPQRLPYVLFDQLAQDIVTRVTFIYQERGRIVSFPLSYAKVILHSQGYFAETEIVPSSFFSPLWGTFNVWDCRNILHGQYRPYSATEPPKALTDPKQYVKNIENIYRDILQRSSPKRLERLMLSTNLSVADEIKRLLSVSKEEDVISLSTVQGQVKKSLLWLTTALRVSEQEVRNILWEAVFFDHIIALPDDWGTGDFKYAEFLEEYVREKVKDDRYKTAKVGNLSVEELIIIHRMATIEWTEKRKAMEEAKKQIEKEFYLNVIIGVVIFLGVVLVGTYPSILTAIGKGIKEAGKWLWGQVAGFTDLLKDLVPGEASGQGIILSEDGNDEDKKDENNTAAYVAAAAIAVLLLSKSD